MKDKVRFDVVYYGILAGIAGGILQNIFTRPFIWTHIIDRGVLEHAQLIMLGRVTQGLTATFVAFIGNLLYSGIFGAFFALLITKYPGHSYMKGIGLGMTAWIITVFITTSLGKNEIGPEESFHAVILLIGGALYGLATAWIYKKLTRKFHYSSV